MSTPERILNSRSFRTFMDWFELAALGLFIFCAFVGFTFLVGLLAWWVLNGF